MTLTKKTILKTMRKNEKRLDAFGVKQIGIFGSFVTSHQTNKSDLDILVEFRKGEKTFDNYAELKIFLQKVFRRKVDLVIKEALKPRLKPYILHEVEYA